MIATHDHLTTAISPMNNVLKTPAETQADEASITQLRHLVDEDMRNVVHPGGVDGAPFWNGNARWFMYAPSFDFPETDGTVYYKFRIIDHNRVRFRKTKRIAPDRRHPPSLRQPGLPHFNIPATGCSTRILPANVSREGLHRRTVRQP